MSEELNQNEKKCHKKLLVAGIILSLVFSVAALTISSIALLGVQGHIPTMAQGQEIPISKKYDRGRSLEKALKKKKPVIIWFYVDWCGYCQKFAPTFDKITKNKEIKKRFAVAFVNCEDQKNTKYANEYQIHGFPTVYLLNPETNEKVLIDNGKLFAPGAEESLVGEFKEFLRAK